MEATSTVTTQFNSLAELLMDLIGTNVDASPRNSQEKNKIEFSRSVVFEVISEKLVESLHVTKLTIHVYLI